MPHVKRIWFLVWTRRDHKRIETEDVGRNRALNAPVGAWFVREVVITERHRKGLTIQLVRSFCQMLE